MQSDSRVTAQWRWHLTLLLVSTVALSVYLLQRGLADIARVGTHLLWPLLAHQKLLGLSFAYMVMTLAWPIVLGALCVATEVSVVRLQTALSSMSTSSVAGFENSVSPFGYILAEELRDPFPKLTWRVFGLLPVLATAVHVLAGLSNLALLRDEYVIRTLHFLHEDPDLSFWPVDRPAITIVAVLVTSTYCCFRAGQFFSALRRFGVSLVACAGQFRSGDREESE
jgi:hypothetical protein